MTRRMVNKKRMFVTVLDFLVSNLTKLTFAPALAGYVTALQGMLTGIGELEQAQLARSKGVTKSKESLKEQVITQLLDIIRRANAYAISSANLVLQDAVKYSYTQLDSMPQNNLVSVAKLMVTTCTKYITEMAGYGLTQPMLDDIAPLLVEYENALPAPKRVIAARKTATEALRIAFAEFDEELKKVDAMMKIISDSDPQFFNEYTNVRVIVDLKGKSTTDTNGSMGITGTVASIETGLNQPGVTVSVVGTNLTALTDAEGNYTLPIAEVGTYSIKAVLAGYDDYTEDDIEVNAGELTEVDFDMEPAT